MKYHTDEEEGDEFEQNDNVMNEDNVSVDNNLIDENEDELLEDEEEDEHEEGDEDDDEQEDEEDDELCNHNSVLQTPQEQVSLTKQYGSPEGHVRKLVKIELWKRIQFIHHLHVLDGYESDGTIGKFVMDRLSIGENCREGFWECYKHVVRKTLKQH